MTQQQKRLIDFLNVESYPLFLPMAKKTIRFRPFVAREQKLLLQAKESKDSKEALDILSQVLSSCIVSEPNFDVMSLSVADYSLLTIAIRSRSVGETAKVRINLPSCGLDDESKPCNTPIDLEIDFNDFKVVRAENPVTKSFVLGNNLAVTVGLPKVEILMLQDLNPNQQDQATQLFKTIAACVESVTVGHETMKPEEIGIDQINELIEALPIDKINAIREFLENGPSVEYQKEVTCKKCGKTQQIVIKDLTTLFPSA